MSNVRIFISAHDKLISKTNIDIHKTEKKVYYSIIQDCKNLGGNVLYRSLGGLLFGKYLDSTIHVEICRNDAPTFMKLIRENHSCIKSIIIV